MRDSISSLFLVVAVASSAFSVWGCSGEVVEEEPEKVLQTRDDGEPTGDGATCSWTSAKMQMTGCGEIPIPSGYGPYELGEDFASPDGCNECTCTDRGIMCTVLECDAVAEGDEGSGEGAAPAPPEDFAPPEDIAPPQEPVEDPDCAVACTKEAKICPDGSSVGREGPNCEFAPCPDESVVCTDDAMECPNGTWVGRSGPNCEFVCDEIACTADAKLCSDGSYVSRQAPDCQFAPCPYEPCEDKGCGEACSHCPPEDSDCVEDAALKFCNAVGECAHEEPVCR